MISNQMKIMPYENVTPKRPLILMKYQTVSHKDRMLRNAGPERLDSTPGGRMGSRIDFGGEVN